jgi:aminopeptidase N
MKKISVLIILFLFFSCGTSKNKELNPPQNPTSEIMWNELETKPETLEIDYTKPKVFHASETILTDLIHTKLEVKFDWKNSWLIGSASITAKPHFYSSDSLILDAKGMEIKNVTLSDIALSYTYDSLFLRIKLDKIYTRFEKYTIKIEYISKPDERSLKGSNAITSDKGLYFINPLGEDKSVMPQIWTQGETESNSVWFPTIDAPNVKTSQEMFITVDEKYQTLSNGKLIKTTKNSDGTKTDHWFQELPHSPYLFMMCVGEFKIVKDSFTRKNGQKIDVNYYVEPEWEKFAKNIFGETPKMIQFFSDLTGIEYPWDKYNQIVVRDYVSGAMENTGAVIFGEFAYKTNRELLDNTDNSTIAHELFHHWFGDLVTCESWSNLPLNESFANYSQYLWDEQRYGIDEADYNAEIEKEGYFASEANGGFHNLIWHNYNDKEQMFDSHSYNKGGRILHMLRNTIGDSAFFYGLKLYLKTNQFKAAEFHNLRLAFEEVSGRDLNWFFDQWFLASGHPILDVEHYHSVQNKEVVLTIYQNQDLATTPLYQLPLEVLVVDDTGEKTYQIVVKKVENKFVFPVVGTLKNIVFDNKQSTLGDFNEDKPQDQFIYQYYNSNRFLARKNALINGTKKVSEKSDQMIIDALSDSFWNIRCLAIEKAANIYPLKLNVATNLISNLAKNDPKPQVRELALLFMKNQLQKDELEQLYSHIIDNDSSYLVVSQALNSLVELNLNLCLIKAKKFENEPSSKIKAVVSQIYALNTFEEKLDFFVNLMNDRTIKGYDEIFCLKSFTLYVSNQNPDIQLKLIPFYEKKYENGSIYVQQTTPQYLTFLSGSIEEKLIEMKEKLKNLEKTNDFKEKDNLSSKILKQELVLKELKALFTKIENTSK